MTWSDSRSWPPHEVALSRERLNKLSDLISNLSLQTDDDTRNALSRFLVVRACGHLELAIDECISKFAEAKSHPIVASHVRGGLFKGNNPRPNTLVERMGRLDSQWAADMQGFLQEDDERRWRELAFLVDRRNAISHGRNENVTTRKSLDLSTLSIEVSDKVAVIINPTN